MTTVIGIDPGLASTGYGVIGAEGSRIRCIDFGVIRTDSGLDLGDRLLAIFDGVTEVIERHRPDEAGIESLYFAKNASSALLVARAMGVVHLALTQAGVPVTEYGPRQIKQAIVGQGRAEKEQVQELLRVFLGLREAPQPDHAADAIAAAVCHHHSSAVMNHAKRAVK